MNRFVARVSDELRERGHDVVVVAPSDSPSLVREGRAAVRRLQQDPDAMFAGPVLAVGQSIPFRRGGRVALPVDVSRTLEDLLERAPLDFVHVHEPFAPSAASAALRHSRALNVGSFHSATERLLSTQVARPLVERLFGRLDGRTASFDATRDLVERFFPGHYEVIPPGADLVEAAPGGGPLEILFCAEEERGALRMFLRALRRLPLELAWRATIWWPDPAAVAPVSLGRKLRERVRLAGPGRRRRGRACWRRPTSWCWRRAARRRPRSSHCAPSGRGPCRWRRACRSTRSACATASSACSSSRATP